MIRLSPQQRIIAWRLALQGSATIGELLHAIYGNDPDGGPDTALSVLKNRVCFLRETLRPYGIGIIGVWGFGYRVPDVQRSRLLDVLADEIERNVVKQKLTFSQHIREAA